MWCCKPPVQRLVLADDQQYTNISKTIRGAEQHMLSRPQSRHPAASTVDRQHPHFKAGILMSTLLRWSMKLTILSNIHVYAR